MGKRRPSLSADQLMFSFDTPRFVRQEAALAGLERIISAAVALALKEDARSRPEVAGAMSSLLGDDVTRAMLDSWASESHELHNISAARFFALIAATDRVDILDTIAIRIGARVLAGEEIVTARVGHLHSQIKALTRELRDIEGRATPFKRATTR